MTERITHDILAEIVGIAADAVICMDEFQRVTFFNKGAEKIFGWTPKAQPSFNLFGKRELTSPQNSNQRPRDARGELLYYNENKAVVLLPGSSTVEHWAVNREHKIT